MTGFFTGATLLVLVAVAGGMARILYGPATADRMMAAQLLGTGGVALLLLLAAVEQSPAIVDVALLGVLLAAFASIAFVKGAAR
jgi:multicomponent Na+:H+ antiporter subunit F